MVHTTAAHGARYVEALELVPAFAAIQSDTTLVIAGGDIRTSMNQPLKARPLIAHGRKLTSRIEAAAARLHELGGERTGAGASLENTARKIGQQLDGVELSFSRMAVAGSLRAWEASQDGQQALTALASSLARHEQDLDALEKLLAAE